MALFRTQKQPRRTPPSLRPFGPRRQRGVRPTRLIPIFPLPSPKIAFEDTTEEQYRAWEAVHGGCPHADALVLTTDLRWIPAGDLRPGDTVASFQDTDFPQHPWRWTVGTVIANRVELAVVVNVTFESGLRVVVTPDHPWLKVSYSRHNPRGKGGLTFCSTDILYQGGPVPRYFIPWEPVDNWEAGWLAGFFDGEGCLCQSGDPHKGTKLGVEASQKESPTLDYLEHLLNKYDVAYRQSREPSERYRNIVSTKLVGGRASLLSFLGRFRPARLLTKLDWTRLGMLTCVSNERVASVEYAGVQPVARLSIDTGTYILEGFGAHNTYPEYLAYRWLEKRGFVSGTDFIFQSSKMGGRQMPGGAVVDFDFPALQLAWRIQGERFHIGDPAVEAKDAIQKLTLTSIGYTVVDVFAQDLLERIEYVLSRAITGEQIVELAG